MACLYHVPLAELDEDEVSRLVNMLSETSNISAGETEIVLGESFALLTKLVLSRQDTGRVFRERQAELAIQAALDILERNVMRDTRGDEQEDKEKYTLSHSCVRYLVGCSLWRPQDEEDNTLRRHLRNRDVMEALGNILSFEDKYSDQYKLNPRDPTHLERDTYHPVLIEMTWAGRTVEYLLQTLIGDKALSPTGVVAPRILRRMADVLIGAPDPLLSDVQAIYAASGDSGERGSQTITEADLVLDGDDFHDDDEDRENDDDDDDGVEDVGSEFAADETKKLTMDEALLSYFKSVRNGYSNLQESNILNLEHGSNQRESLMSNYWHCDTSICDAGVIIETEEERNERMQQHQVFVYYRGLQRVLYFIAQRQTSDEEKMYGVYEDAFGPSEIISECSEQLLRFRGIIKKKLEEELSKATAAGKKHAEDEENDPRKESCPPPWERNRGWRQAAVTACIYDGKCEQQRRFVRQLSSQLWEAEGNGADCPCRGFPSHCLRVATFWEQKNPHCRRRNFDGQRSVPAAGQRCDRGQKFPDVVFNVHRCKIHVRYCGDSPHSMHRQVCAYDPLCRRMTLCATSLSPFLRMLVGRLQSQTTLQEADEILAMHTAYACAIVAEQLPHVIKPGQGSMEGVMEQKMVEYLYSRLFSRELLKCFVKLLLYDMQESLNVPGPEANLEDLKRRADIRQTMRDSITTVIVEFLRNSEQHRFEVLEQFTREEVENAQATRQSYLQDLLSEVNRRVYPHSPREVYARAGLF